MSATIIRGIGRIGGAAVMGLIMWRCIITLPTATDTGERGIAAISAAMNGGAQHIISYALTGVVAWAIVYIACNAAANSVERM